jgi:hypothetical protein
MSVLAQFVEISLSVAWRHGNENIYGLGVTPQQHQADETLSPHSFAVFI